MVKFSKEVISLAENLRRFGTDEYALRDCLLEAGENDLAGLLDGGKDEKQLFYWHILGEKIRTEKLSAFVRGYLECALWSSTEYGEDGGQIGDSLDENYGPDDIDGETLAGMIEDCHAFQREEAENLEEYYGTHSEENAGHDFWLSRNGHGAGFFDDGFDMLQKAARMYGTVDLWADGEKVYAS